MPTYEYTCDACNNAWELEQRISDEPVKKCPSCGKLKAHRLISQGNFVLKGGGWYSDLYSKPSASKSPASGKSSDETKPIKTATTTPKTKPPPSGE